VAIFIRGKSTCPLCGQILATEDLVVAFAPFLQPDHRLWRYSDSAMHATCFAASPDRDELEALYAEERETQRALATPERIEVRRRADEQKREAHDRSAAEHNARHARIMAAVNQSGATCPHCNARSTSYRELSGTARLRLGCRACGRSCNADELALG